MSKRKDVHDVPGYGRVTVFASQDEENGVEKCGENSENTSSKIQKMVEKKAAPRHIISVSCVNKTGWITMADMTLELPYVPGEDRASFCEMLVQNLFSCALEMASGQRDYSHIWTIYHGSRQVYSSYNYPDMCGDSEDDEEDFGFMRRRTENLSYPRPAFDRNSLKAGDRLRMVFDEYSGRRITVDFSVNGLSDPVAGVDYPRLVEEEQSGPQEANATSSSSSSSAPAAPKSKPPATSYTAEEVAASTTYRERRRELLASGRLVEFSRSQHRHGKANNGIIPQRPENWSDDERTVGMMCIESGNGFKKCWTEVLQHGLLTRTETCASSYWYQLQKRMKACGHFQEPAHKTSLASANLFSRCRHIREDILAPGSRHSLAAMENSLHDATEQMHTRVKWLEAIRGNGPYPPGTECWG